MFILVHVEGHRLINNNFSHRGCFCLQAARLSRNCEKLLNLLKSVDAQLARVLDGLVKGKMELRPDAEGALQQLMAQLIRGGRLMQVSYYGAWVLFVQVQHYYYYNSS